MIGPRSPTPGGEHDGIHPADGRVVGAEIFLQPIPLDVDGKLAALVTLAGPVLDVAPVGVLVGDAQHAALPVEDAVHGLGPQAFLAHNVVADGRVVIAGARSHHQAFQRREAHGGVHRDAVFHRVRA